MGMAAGVSWLGSDIGDGGRRNVQQPTDLSKIISTGAAGEQAVVADGF